MADGDVDEVLPDAELVLEAGDVLWLHTDGYTEAKVARRMLGSEELSQRFAARCGRGLPLGALIASSVPSSPLASAG